jgi:hypothetical protein
MMINCISTERSGAQTRQFDGEVFACRFNAAHRDIDCSGGVAANNAVLTTKKRTNLETIRFRNANHIVLVFQTLSRFLFCAFHVSSCRSFPQAVTRECRKLPIRDRCYSTLVKDSFYTELRICLHFNVLTCFERCTDQIPCNSAEHASTCMVSILQHFRTYLITYDNGTAS